jgi:hypothetical protein
MQHDRVAGGDAKPPEALGQIGSRIHKRILEDDSLDGRSLDPSP